MKKRQKKAYPKSFASRLTKRIMLLMIVLMSIASYGLFFIFYDSATNIITLYSSEMVSSTSKSVHQVLSDVYVATVNNIPDIEANLQHPDKLYKQVERMVKQNPRIRSCGISFIDNYYPERGCWFCPYAVKRGADSIEVKTIGSQQHDYLKAEWFVEACQADKGYWSKPFFDGADSTALLTSYMAPIRDTQGRTVAVLGVDLSLDWLSAKIQKDFYKTIEKVTDIWSIDELNVNFDENDDDSDESITINNNATDVNFLTPYMFIVNREGTFIAHPDTRRILRDNILTITKETNDSLDDKLARLMTTGAEGNVTIQGDKKWLGMNIKDRYVFFTPLEHVDWSMGFIFPCIIVKAFSFGLGISLLFFTLLPLMLAIFIFGHIVIKRSVKPVKKLAMSADEVAKGHFNNELPQVKSRDEIQMLRDSFGKMQLSLKHYMMDLQATTAAKTAIENELKIAHDIQMSMLPKTYPPFPERTDIDIYGSVTPAKAVGGDLFDFFIRDEQLFFCIGDVSGKGIPAAMLMAVTRSLFRNVAAYSRKPDAIVTALNNSLADHNDNEMFVTLFIGVLDLTTGRLDYCNAGHNAPLMMDGEGHRVEMLPVDPNLPAGVEPEWTFTLQHTLLAPQATIFLYTDGLTEAENSSHEQFQDERMISVASDSSHESERLIAEMTEAIHSFVGDAEQSDDLTMLAIRHTVALRNGVTLQRSITLPNDVEEVPRLAAFVDDVCETAGIDAPTTASMNLAIEEAVVNIMDYAYPEGTTGNVHILAEVDTEQLTFVVSDWAEPFDPTARPDVDIDLPVDERPIGGLGIHMVRQIMDNVSYETIDGMNRLTLNKKLGI